MKLLPRKDILVFIDNLVVKNGNNYAGIHVRHHGKGIGSRFLGNQSRYDDVRIDNRINLICLFLQR